MRKSFGFHTKFVCRDASGAILWLQDWTHNDLCNEGEKNVLDTYLRAQNAPSSFRVRLFNDTPVETDSLSSLSSEPGGLVGYSPQTINRDASASGWPTLSNESSAGDFQAEAVTVTFRPTGTWIVTYAVLATSSDNTGLLIDATALSRSRTLSSGNTLQVSYQIRLA